MNGTLIVNAWVGIHAGCTMAYNVSGSDGAYVTLANTGQPFGNQPPFEFFFEADALRQFVELGHAALAEMDTLAVQEGASSA